MADDDRWRASRHREGRYDENRGLDETRRAYGAYDDQRRDQRERWRREEDRERGGYWGSNRDDRGFGDERGRDYSREDYGSTDRGPETFEGRGFGRFEEGRSQFRDRDLGRTFQNYGRTAEGYGGERGERNRYARDTDRSRDEERGFFERAADEVSSWFGDRDAERRRELDHRGRGPKGYRRSDARIQEDVSDRLADDPYVDASDVEVAVANGEVTLSGSVDSRHARRRAEDIAEQVSGVSYVQNNLRQRHIGGAADTAAGATASGAARPESAAVARGTGFGTTSASPMAPMTATTSGTERTGANGDKPRAPI